MIHIGPYQDTAEIYESLFPAWEAPRGPFFMGQDGVLTIQITPSEDGKSVSPDFNMLVHVLRQYDTALLNISISPWDIWKNDPQTVALHAGLLFHNPRRWKSLRIHAHLLNFLLRLHPPNLFQAIPASNLESLKIDELHHEAARSDNSYLPRFFKHIFFAVPHQLFKHLDLGGSTPFDYDVGLSRQVISSLPFNHLRSLAITTSISGSQAHQILVAGGDTIEEVFINGVSEPCPKPDIRPALVQNLRVLKLMLCYEGFTKHRFQPLGWVFALLRKIKTSYKFEELTLGYENEWDSNAFAEFYRNSCTGSLPVRCLRLEKMRMNLRQFKACMDLNPCVSELVVDCQDSDTYNGKTPGVLFTRQICKLFPENYGSHLTRLVVQQECIERSACFGRMITRLATDYNCSLVELIIIGENAESNLHPEDQKALKDLQKNQRGAFSLRYAGRGY